jgi:putative endonuclease
MPESPVGPAHIRLGTRAEELAVHALQQRGFRLIERNWRCTSGELDAIMWDRDELVFVEVKARTGMARGSAEEALTTAKARKLATAAEWYLSDHPEIGDPIWRIDLIAITVDRSGAIVRFAHIANAAQFS